MASSTQVRNRANRNTHMLSVPSFGQPLPRRGSCAAFSALNGASTARPHPGGTGLAVCAAIPAMRRSNPCASATGLPGISWRRPDRRWAARRASSLALGGPPQTLLVRGPRIHPSSSLGRLRRTSSSCRHAGGCARTDLFGDHGTWQADADDPRASPPIWAESCREMGGRPGWHEPSEARPACLKPGRGRCSAPASGAAILNGSAARPGPSSRRWGRSGTSPRTTRP
jgi:hypothetical protein